MIRWGGIMEERKDKKYAFDDSDIADFDKFIKKISKEPEYCGEIDPIEKLKKICNSTYSM